MKEETRNFARKLIRGNAAVLPPGAAPIRGKTKDVSLGGICVAIPDPLPSGKSCTVMFEAPLNGKIVHITATAKVVYSILRGSEGFRTGLQFTQIDAANNKLLAELML